MIVKYPYILIGVLMILSPFALTFGLHGGMILLMLVLIDGIDTVEFIYDFMEDTDEKILVIFPFYTYHAYEQNSLADIGTEQCNGCEEYQFLETDFSKIYTDGVSDIGGSVFEITDFYYNRTSDAIISSDGVYNNDSIFSTVNSTSIYDYDKIILMRHEYITAEFYNAIEKHDNVIYMFPDAMTKQVFVHNNTMKYVGDLKPLHPQSFEFADDNRCNDWEFIPVKNGHMMNCTPDIAIINNQEMLLTIRDI